MRIARLLFFLIPAIGTPQGHRACVIQGTVVDALNGTPLAKTKVFVIPGTDDDKPTLPVRRIADSSGQFCFEHLDPGDYRLRSERAAYLDAIYGQPRPGTAGLRLEVQRGKALQPLLIKMTPQAVITGTLVDAEGDPIAGAPINLARRALGQGKIFPYNVQQTQTDDEGKFRLSEIPPGIYYLSAQPNNMNRIDWISDALDGEGRPIREQQVETFYKDSLSFAGATPIPLKAGQELDGLVLTREKIVGHRLSGHIAPDLIGTDSPNIMAMGATGRFFTMRVENDGSFHSDALPPGKYSLRISTQGKEFRSEVDLTAGDVDGVVLEPVELLNFEASLRVEGVSPKELPIDQFSLEGNGTHGYQGEPQSDGRFKFKDVRPGVYELFVRSGHFFVKRILVDGELQESRQLDLTRREPKVVEVVLSSRVARLHVEVRAAHKPTAAVTLLLENENEYYDGVARADGEFDWEFLTPGKYRLYAFEDFDPGAWGNPDLVSAFASKSLEIELHEDEHARAKPPLISATEFQKALQRLGY